MISATFFAIHAPSRGSHRSARIIALLTLLALATPLAAQETPVAPSPSIPSYGKGLGDFIPPDWKGIDTARGDLNADGVSDYALVIEHIDSTIEERLSAHNPRILLVLFGNRAGGLKLSARADSLISSADEGDRDDPFMDGEFKIQHGCIILTLTGGLGNGSGEIKYRFQYRNSGWFLIGATASESGISQFHGDDPDAEVDRYISTYDYNLLTGNLIHTVDDDNPKRNKHWQRRLPVQPLPEMETFVPHMLTLRLKGVKREEILF